VEFTGSHFVRSQADVDSAPAKTLQYPKSFFNKTGVTGVKVFKSSAQYDFDHTLKTANGIINLADIYGLFFSELFLSGEMLICLNRQDFL